MSNRFQGIIYDDANRTFDIVRATTNNLFTNNVVEMMNAGMEIHCQEAPDDAVPSAINLPNFKHEMNLYTRLIEQYKQITGRQLKQW